MARKKPPEDFAALIQKEYDIWEHYHAYGGSDPGYADGVNMNLLRNHILYYRRQIEENMQPQEYPDIYHRELPPEVDRDYMARKEEIKAAAVAALAQYKSDENYMYLRRRLPRLPPKLRQSCNAEYLVHVVSGLEKGIAEENYVEMRRHENRSYIERFAGGAERARNVKMPDNEQLTLFTDYSDDAAAYDADDDASADDEFAYGNESEYADGEDFLQLFDEADDECIDEMDFNDYNDDEYDMEM